MNRVLFVFTPLIVGFCSLPIHPYDTKERITEMRILLVPVGEIDEKVMGRLQVDLGKIFNEQIEVGQRMPHPGYILNKKRNQYFQGLS